MPAIISEIRYRNGPNSDPDDDFIEIRVPTGDPVAGLRVQVYNPSGTLRSSTLIETAPMSTVGNFDYYVISARINRFGAVSLDDNGTVLRFVSFDDEVTATQGAASGQASDQVGTNGTDDTASLSSTDGVTFVPDPNPSPGAPCFAAGTRIMTDQGERAVESLQPGDLVLSHDGALVPLRMALSRRLHRTDLFKYPKLRPVRIVAGAVGQSLPRRDLLVSRQHRMLVQSRIAQRMFGTDAVLISAARMTAIPGIFVDTDLTEITYFHLVFDRHIVLYADGAPSESLFAGPEAMASLTSQARDELLLLFPHLSPPTTMASACYIPGGKHQKKLMARHLSNNKPLLDQCFNPDHIPSLR